MSRKLLLGASLLVALLVSSTARADFVLVKQSNNTTARLTKDAAKGVFSGRTKTWSNGDAIILVIGSEDSPGMQWLAPALFGVSAKTYLTKIKQDVFKGDVRHPLSADDDASTLKRIASQPGVVGWISERAAKSLPSGFAILPLD